MTQLKYCDGCEKVTKHTVLNSGNKVVCHECKTTVEYGYEE